jgi:hypothetical protein
MPGPLRQPLPTRLCYSRAPFLGELIAMDKRHRPKVDRRLAAIVAADIAGYSTLMGADETRTVADLKAHQGIVLPMIGEHGGRIIDTAGDGILAEFGSVVNAVECAAALGVNERHAREIINQHGVPGGTWAQQQGPARSRPHRKAAAPPGGEVSGRAMRTAKAALVPAPASASASAPGIVIREQSLSSQMPASGQIHRPSVDAR